jgi:hypothetical protein
MPDRINVTDDGKVWKEILTEGTGDQASDGQKVRVHNTGTLEDGTKFDSSRDRDDPFEFTIGSGVIQGWSVGVATMKVGERSKFTIDSEYGYGASGSPPKIPGGATLIFDIELLEILGDEEEYKTNEEAIAAAEELCRAAAETFKAGDFNASVKTYKKALDIIEMKYGDDLNDITLRLQRNLAVSYAKVLNWKESLSFAEKVLKKEANDPRALLRKTEANLRLGNLVEARKALTQGLAVTKNGPPFVALRGEIEAEEKAERQRETELFKKMVRK